jgi:biopolymer transport protein ExbD/biopolymer transport protein TolR
MASLSRKGASRPAPVMNVTPLVDVVLVLLIIFMVIVPMMQKGVDVQLPKIFHVDEEPKGETDPFVLSVTEDGSMYFDKEKLSEEDFKSRLEKANRKEPGRRLMLRADTKTDYGDVRRLFKICQDIGFPGISLRVNERNEEQS